MGRASRPMRREGPWFDPKWDHVRPPWQGKPGLLIVTTLVRSQVGPHSTTPRLHLIKSKKRFRWVEHPDLCVGDGHWFDPSKGRPLPGNIFSFTCALFEFVAKLSNGNFYHG